MVTPDVRMLRWVTGVSLLDHRRNYEILEEANVVPIAMVTRRRRWEWLGHAERRDESETIRAVAEMKMEGKRPRGRPKLEIHCQKGPETVAPVNRQTKAAAEIRQKYVRNTSEIRQKYVKDPHTSNDCDTNTIV